MVPNPTVRLLTRREMFEAARALAGGSLVFQLFGGKLAAAGAQQAAAPQADRVAAFRAQMAAIPIAAQKLADNLTLLSGPGGNVVVLNGAEGKVVVDTFVSPAWPKLKEALEGLGPAALKTVIDTHWHFDHTDNNARLHAAGATVLAHENTKKRMAESHELAVLGLTFPPSPAAALPQQTFRSSHKLQANGERLSLVHIPPAHTDTDIYIHFERANVLQAGDVFFNGLYPYIDGSTGGSVSGMIAGADKMLAVADNSTRIVPGHGPLGDKASLAKFRDMLSTVRDRLQKLKTSGKSIEEAVAAKPLADLDETWAKGLFNGDTFVQIAYGTL